MSDAFSYWQKAPGPKDSSVPTVSPKFSKDRLQFFQELNTTLQKPEIPEKVSENIPEKTKREKSKKQR